MKDNPEMKRLLQAVTWSYKKNYGFLGDPDPAVRDFEAEEGELDPIEKFAEDIRALAEEREEMIIGKRELAQLYKLKPFKHKKHGEPPVGPCGNICVTRHQS